MNPAAARSSRKDAPRHSALSRAGAGLFTALLDFLYAGLGVFALAVSPVRGRFRGSCDHLRRRVLLRPPRRRGDARCLWIHGVSVGEVLAARPLLQALPRELPGWEAAVTSSTRAGVEAARRLEGPVLVASAPVDLSFLVRRAFRAFRPAAYVVIEHDLWPNHLRIAERLGVPVAWVNARLSPSSRRGFKRLLRFYPRLRELIGLVCAQDEESAEAIGELGFARSRIAVTGNLKFDSPVPAADGIREELGIDPQAPVLVGASTHEGEEEAVLEAFREVRARSDRARLILAPRRPERAAAVERLIRLHGFACRRRTRETPSSWDVLLLDTVGELARLMAAGDVVFVGGSLAPVGGHSIIEPAAHGLAILLGPHHRNLGTLVEDFRSREAVAVVPEVSALAPAVHSILEDRRRLEAMGKAARELYERHRGAGERTLRELRAFLAEEAAP